jgi:hypothetical protein
VVGTGLRINESLQSEQDKFTAELSEAIAAISNKHCPIVKERSIVIGDRKIFVSERQFLYFQSLLHSAEGKHFHRLKEVLRIEMNRMMQVAEALDLVFGVKNCKET